MESIITSLISAVAATIAAILAYNQYAKNKLTDLKIDKYRRDMDRKFSKRADDIACIYSELYRLLHDLEVDRVYILQPHPLINNLFVTISMQVRRKGVSSMLDQIHRLPMGEVAAFVGELAKNSWIWIDDLDAHVLDKKAKAIMSVNGTVQVVIKKLVDVNNRWIGSLFIENTEIDPELNTTVHRLEIEEVANNIQFILPEYSDSSI